MKLFKKKDQTPDVAELENQQPPELIEEPTSDISPIANSTMDDLENVGNTSNEIKQQSLPKSIFSGGKNIRALAENDLVISKVLKNMLDWLLVVTSAETLRREEYEDLTEQMLKFDEDVTVQLEMQVKFKRAFEQLQAKQNEHSKLIRQLITLKKIVIVSSVFSLIAMIIAIFALV
jgi:hypothetical protein